MFWFQSAPIASIAPGSAAWLRIELKQKPERVTYICYGPIVLILGRPGIRQHFLAILARPVYHGKGGGFSCGVGQSRGIAEHAAKMEHASY